MLPLPYQSLLLFQLHYSIYKLISLSYSSSYLNPFCLSVSCPDHHFLFSIQFFYQSPIPPVYFFIFKISNNFLQFTLSNAFSISIKHIFIAFPLSIYLSPIVLTTPTASLVPSSSPKSILFRSSILLHFPP